MKLWNLVFRERMQKPGEKRLWISQASAENILSYIMFLLDLNNTTENLESRPYEHKALVLAVAFSGENKSQLKKHWEQLKKKCPPTSEDRQILEMAEWLLENFQVAFTNPGFFWDRRMDDHKWFPYLLALLSASALATAEKSILGDVS